jgi:hypothetical protein
LADGAAAPAGLIQIKAMVTAATMMPLNFKEWPMSTASIVVLSGIVLAFVVFATVLMWGDLYSHAVKR